MRVVSRQHSLPMGAKMVQYQYQYLKHFLKFLAYDLFSFYRSVVVEKLLWLSVVVENS